MVRMSSTSQLTNFWFLHFTCSIVRYVCISYLTLTFLCFFFTKVIGDIISSLEVLFFLRVTVLIRQKVGVCSFSMPRHKSAGLVLFIHTPK